MSREPNERTFAAALSNEYQWRNLYLKEFGCCTYAPPMPKDPSTTADGVYPTRRQVVLLQRESSSSSSSGSDLESDLEEMGVTRLNSDLMTDPGEHSGFFSNSNANLSRSILSRGTGKSSTVARPHWRPHSRGREGPVGGDPHRQQNNADQFFSLDMSASGSLHHSNVDDPRRTPRRGSNSHRRSGQNTVLRKDDFFDPTDVLSNRFFSFLWVSPEDEEDTDDPDTSEGRTTEDDGRRQGGMGGSINSRHGQLSRHDTHGSNDAHFLPFSRPNLTTPGSHAFDTNPRGLPDAILRLHQQTWALLMDNRLMAWVHRETVDHCQSATQLRQRLLEIIARGPASFAGVGAGAAAGYAASVSTTSALALPQEDALQRTLESFSPFFVVISPPAAVQRVTDQLQTARRNQKRHSASPQHATTVAAADLIGLPLLSQYGTWREAYEHRHRWEKAPFSFFFLHDVSYNFTQVTALFVELQLLYVHAHTHTQHCVGGRRESVMLQKAGRQLATHAGSTRPADGRQHVCPLLLMQETTENIIVAFEQSSSRAALPMLRRVLDFLTDAALDAVTAHRFVSREALLRQHQFELPGMTSVRPTSTAVPLSTSVPTASLGDLSGVAASATSEVSLGPASSVAGVSNSPFTDPRTDKPPPSPGMQDLAGEDGGGPSTPTVFPEPQRVTERDVNGLFELAYWLVDAATANARVPLDPALLAGTAADAGARVATGRLGGGTTGGAGPPTTQPSPETSPEQLYLNGGDRLLTAVGAGSQSPTQAAGRRGVSTPVPPSGTTSRPVSAQGDTGATQPWAASAGAGRPPQYLPGRVQVHPPVESLAEAVALLEAHRKPTRARDERATRGRRGSAGRRKRQSLQPSEGGGARRSLYPASHALPAPVIAPVPSLDTFVGFVSPLVVLTTYLRLHGGTWLKQLCTRVFETLRRPTLVLYVNTLELDAAWSALLPPLPPQPPSPATSEALKYGGGDGGLARARMRRRSTALNSVFVTASAAMRPPSATSAAAAGAGEAARTEFLSGLGRLEDLICQDIVFALNDFFGNLYGRRAAAGRLPQGICVLLTQFVSTMHLYMLESVGATRAAAAAASGNANRSRAARPMSRGSTNSSAAEDAPSRIVEDCLRVCKQRYYAGLRRRGGAGETGESLAYTARDAEGLAGRQGSSGGTSPASGAPSSLPRLLQTIEQHRLAKFILFDCWILPALNNATSLGYLAPDSPLHLRWNIDALARYLKVLVHGPFVEQDKQNFASLAPAEPAEPQGRRESGAARRQGLRSTGDRRTGRSRPGTQSAARSAARPAVLSLPPYLTGIYDVVTGSLVRVQTMLLNPGRKPSTSMSLLMSEAGDMLTLPPGMQLSPNTLTTPMAPAALTRVSGDRRTTMVSLIDSPLSAGQSGMGDEEEEDESELSGDEASLQEATPSQGGQSKRTIAATAVPPSVAATQAAAPTATRVPASRQSRVQRGSGQKGGKSTLPARSVSSSRLFTEEEEAAAAAAEVDRGPGPLSRPPGLYRDTGSFSSTPHHGDDESRSPPRRRRAGSDGLGSILGGHDSGGGAGRRRAPPPLDSVGSGASYSAVHSTSLAAPVHPYVVMDDAVWLDMSPALQSLNDNVGLTLCERGGVGAGVGDQDVGSPISRLPKLHRRGDSGLPSAAASVSGRGGPGGLHARANSADSSTLADLSYFDVPALQMLDAFAYAACTDDSDHVVVSEFDVLPSMAAGCLERLYELTTDTHPMVLHALQSGVFHLAFDHHDTAQTRNPTGLTSLYSACLNGVLLHPRTAAHVLKNVLENNVPFSETLLRPVSDTTALNLIGQLAGRSRDIPMVDVNAVVPLLQSMAPARGGGAAAGRMLQASGSALPLLSPQSAAPAAAAAKSAAVARRWERESRRLLREFVFLTTGHSDYGPPLPLAPGLHRPVGPPHPIQMIRAGSARITADTGGVTPMVFDPWWRAMVVALCVKASNMFAECGGEQAATFDAMRHTYAEESRRAHRHTSAHFVTSKGRETGEKDLATVASLAGKRESLTVRPTITATGSAVATPGRKLKKKTKTSSTVAAAAAAATAKRKKVKKAGTRKAAAPTG